MSYSPEEQVQDQANGGQPQQAAPQPQAQPSAGLQQPAQQQAPAQPQPQEQVPEHHSTMGKVFDGVLSTLGGGPDVSYAVDAQGNMHAQKTPLKPGDAMKRMLAGALSGLAGAAQTPSKPGAPLLTGVGAGAQANTNRLKQQDEEKKMMANNDYVRRANQAKLQQDMATAALDNTRKRIEMNDSVVNQDAKMHADLTADPRNKDLGVARDIDDFMAMHRDGVPDAGLGPGDLLKRRSDLHMFPNYVKDEKTGLFTTDGVHVVLTNPDVAKQKNEEEVQIPRFDPTANGGMGGYRVVTIPPYSYTNAEIWTMQGVSAKEAQVWAEKQHPTYGTVEAASGAIGAIQAKHDDPNTPAAAKPLLDQQLASAKAQKAAMLKGEEEKTEGNEKAKASASMTYNAVSEGVPKTNSLTGKPLPIMPHKDGVAAEKSFNKDYVQDLNRTEQTYSQLQDIMSRPLTGAASIVALFDAIGISSSSLKGRGFRINNDIVKEHAGARGVLEGVVAKLNKIEVGAVITPKQIGDYTDILIQARHDMYMAAVNQAQRQGLDPVLALPRPMGTTQLDPHTKDIFVDAAGGNRDTARRVASNLGWTF